jgi:membrane protein YqaA with SNARE-associated domain
MPLSEYIIKALSVFLVSFIPPFEFALAVPTGLVIGLDHVSILIWSALGNVAGGTVAYFVYGRILHHNRLGKWLRRAPNLGLFTAVQRQQTWFILFNLPWMGVGTAAINARHNAIRWRRFGVLSFISITFHAALLLLLLIGGANLLDIILEFFFD